MQVLTYIFRGIIKDSHSVYVRDFSNILNRYGNSYFSIFHTNNDLKRTCLFFTTVHLVKNLKNNFLNSKKLMFPAFEYSDFNIQCSDVYVILGDMHKIYDFDKNLQSHLKKALKLSYQVLHSGNNKENVLLALLIFEITTVTVSGFYFPDRPYINVFSEIFQDLWTIANSKHRFHPKETCNSAGARDKNLKN